MANETRGRRSKVDLLPDPIRKKLDAGLRNGSIQQIDLLDEINALIKAAGLPEENQLSRAGINRYATKMEAVGKSLREMREITQVWTAELGDKPTGEVTKLILEMARSQLFKALLNQDET
ncbi:MAG: phage protein Gp27 family protein, partial [Shewanella oncorhynchi]